MFNVQVKVQGLHQSNHYDFGPTKNLVIYGQLLVFPELLIGQ